MVTGPLLWTLLCSRLGLQMRLNDLNWLCIFSRTQRYPSNAFLNLDHSLKLFQPLVSESQEWLVCSVSSILIWGVHGLVKKQFKSRVVDPLEDWLSSPLPIFQLTLVCLVKNQFKSTVVDPLEDWLSSPFPIFQLTLVFSRSFPESCFSGPYLIRTKKPVIICEKSHQN